VKRNVHGANANGGSFGMRYTKRPAAQQKRMTPGILVRVRSMTAKRIPDAG
jgi:hypothetical protein